ncbi:tyrosine-type recombinase/integrase [Mycobacterium intracellulare]|uniref:tyrosine-type recombinase/integrase n=1 Tax=Mycobacterium intracellulare TaxID=1767 RepID=UPI000BAACBDA|nr:site-specific integrase [Mycobacterium intracellulare]ASW94667.1 integrase [Mycobacterium intracellulare]MCA2234252.1 site-specific integrase [Mycobacterium intracellulare]PBA21546.1 integrase [Mycobacterium intracellulare]
MSGKSGHRAWGHIKRQRTKQASYQASFIGPDLRRHYAPHTFSSRMNAEAWLVRERDYRDRCSSSGDKWKPPAERATEKKAEVLLFGVYGKRVIDQRKLSPRTRIEYESKWSALIEPTFGKVAVSDLNPTAVRAWFSALDATKERRNSHAYGILSMICNTAVKDGLLERNPCMIVGAMNTKPKPNVKPITIVELHTIADKLGANENHARFKALVLLAGWCGLRIGEVTELRRKDISATCDVVSITRAVNHRSGKCLLGPTKTGETRDVDIPPHIQADIKDHLALYVSSDPDDLLFKPARGGCHLNDRVFNKDVFQKAAKDVGREDLSAHDLRRFAGTTNARVGATMAENMRRLGHRTFKAAMLYQHAYDDSGKKLAADLSAHALAELRGDRHTATA